MIEALFGYFAPSDTHLKGIFMTVNGKFPQKR